MQLRLHVHQASNFFPLVTLIGLGDNPEEADVEVVKYLNN